MGLMKRDYQKGRVDGTGLIKDKSRLDGSNEKRLLERKSGWDGTNKKIKVDWMGLMKRDYQKGRVDGKGRKY